jgi:hypothetical protein
MDAPDFAESPVIFPDKAVAINDTWTYTYHSVRGDKSFEFRLADVIDEDGLKEAVIEAKLASPANVVFTKGPTYWINLENGELMRYEGVAEMHKSPAIRARTTCVRTYDPRPTWR